MKIKETNKKDKKGFTMIEILIVVAIIAVLAITIIPMISNYIQKGKDEYNEKLKNQLLVSGKEYYTNNKVKLPVKNYLGVYKNNKDYSYVTLPEIQSENYVSKDFVDADKRECSKSYVYVRQNDDGKDYEWHACLICSGEDGKTINYSKGDPTCEIVDWGDTKSPTCSEDANFVGERNNNNKVFNPKEVYLKDLADQYNDTKEGKLAGIEIKNKTTNEVFYVKANSNSIKANEGIDLMSKITATFKEKNEREGEYEIRVYDTAFKMSDACANFIIDETAPRCKLDSYYDNSVNKKYLKLTTDANDRRTDDIEGQERFKTIISDKEISNDFDYINNNGRTVKPGKPYYPYDVTGKVGQYYGLVMDEAGNKGRCSLKVDMILGEDPKCSVLDTADGKWYSKDGTNKYKTMAVECYVAGGVNATIDEDQIYLSQKSGTITKAEDRAGNTDTKNKVRYKITYTPKANQYYKDEKVVINKGFVTDSIGTTNTSTSSNYIKVDSIKPTIKYTPEQSGGWYKSPFELKMSCSDSQSGVKTFKVNGKAVDNPKTITRKKAAKPGTWTTSCTDNAGNSKSDTKKYYVRVYGTCSCKTAKRCKKAGCASWHYATGYKYQHVYSHSYCSSSKMNTGATTCKAAWYGQIKCRCSTNSSCPKNRNWLCKCWTCSRTSYSYADYCNYYKRSESKCGCETYNYCWHY